MASCWEWTENVHDYTSGGAYRWVGPLGAIVATADLVDCIPILGPADVPPGIGAYIRDCEHEGELPHQIGGLWLLGPSRHGAPCRIEVQRPFGDYTPGRWGWLLDNVQRCDPVPARGKQGLWNWEPA